MTNPSKILPELAELIGIIIGDGYIHRNRNSYRIGVVGNPITDKEYFQFIRGLIFSVWKKDVRIVERERGLRITFGSKTVFEQLTKKFGLPLGEGKCERVFIPDSILYDWNLTKNTIRGIVDTDGSVFTASKPGILRYPSIEITTSSIVLAKQIRTILLEHDFKVANIWNYKSKLSKRTTYKVPLNGMRNLSKWIEEIGFSNPYKLKKAKEALNGTAGI